MPRKDGGGVKRHDTFWQNNVTVSAVKIIAIQIVGGLLRASLNPDPHAFE
jgi:hypothetical protein